MRAVYDSGGMRVGAEKKDGKSSGQEKRKLYVMAFVIALSIDLVFSFVKGVPYKPSLLGLAIMIASVLYFGYSWLRNR
jgi:hypothetical protein